MSDEELIKRLRHGEGWPLTAADRIEELGRQLDELQDRLDTANKARAVAKQNKLDKEGIAALETILNERGPVFDAMVDAAEDAAGKDVSFNVVVGRAIRAALTILTMLAELEEKPNE